MIQDETGLFFHRMTWFWFITDVDSTSIKALSVEKTHAQRLHHPLVQKGWCWMCFHETPINLAIRGFHEWAFP